MQEHVKGHNRDQLNFELNLRQHRIKTDYKHDAPWLYPSTKSFTPAVVLNSSVEYVQESNYNAIKNKFQDRFFEANANAILHTLDKSTSVYRTSEWVNGLRGDREERVR